MLDCDLWLKNALAGLPDMPMSHEPMRLAREEAPWLVWRRTSQRGVCASGTVISIKHHLALTLSCPEDAPHQELTRQVQQALQAAKGCLYARIGGDQWNPEAGRRECALNLGILEVM